MTAQAKRNKATRAAQAALGALSSKAVLEIGKLPPWIFDLSLVDSKAQDDARSLKTALKGLSLPLIRAAEFAGRVNRYVPVGWPELPWREDVKMGSWMGDLQRIQDEIDLVLTTLDYKGGRDRKIGVFHTALAISGALDRAVVPSLKHPLVIRACFDAIGLTIAEADTATRLVRKWHTLHGINHPTISEGKSPLPIR